MLRLHVALMVTSLASGLAACSTDETAAVEPPFADGKADVGDRVANMGPLAFGAEATGAFGEDLQFFGYTIDARAGAKVTLEVTQRGTRRGLDTTLYVYGPATQDGTFGEAAIAFDDDAGYGKLSKLRGLALAEGGTYLVVLGTHDGRGRGDYRITAGCDDGAGACDRPTAGSCPTPIAADVRACVASFLAEPDNAGTGELDATEQCADAEPVADAYDAACAASPAPSWCGDYETFATTVLPGCLRELQGEIYDRTCAVGGTFHDLRRGATVGVLVVGRRVLTGATGLDAVLKQQIVSAVHVSSHVDVTTAAQAFERVDQGEINVYELWDATNRRSYQALEYGAGDNSYGRIFQLGTTQTVADIQDGDLYACAAFMGRELRPCATDVDCGGALRCVGKPEDFPRGRCVDLTADVSPAEGSACSATAACPSGSGLLCAGLTRGDEGLCAPVWTRGYFETRPDLAIPDGRAAGATSTLYAYGLATVDTDVTIDLVILHARPADLKVVLINPAGAEVTIFDDAAAAGVSVELYGQPVAGFSGDESVNGAWQLKVVDRRSGGASTGTVESWSLTLGSRWD